jgi:DNA-binding CsgD family transcriptional regulator
MLIGRETETAGLGKLLHAARLGTSGAMVLRGEAGIGKTALLEHAASMADGFMVLRATGIESEAELPYAALHQLLRPLQDRIDRLAEPQARALSGALGLAHEREADPFLIGVGVLTLLGDAAEEQPVLALLDDAAWFDHESAHALGFTARRLHAEGVVLLFSARDGTGQPFALPGVADMRVERLADADARQLLGDRVDAARREDVVARAHGNPLALLELASGPDGAAAPGGAEEAFARRVDTLPERTQALLLIAAADTTRSLAVVGAAAAGLGLDAAALEPAESDGLVRAAAGTIEFRHPLVRSAVYNASPFEARARAHRALADALAGDHNADRRAWHHAAAVLGTDEDAAAELEGTASRAIERSGHAAAASALERAADLSPAEGDRARRLVVAAREATLAGERERALVVLDRAGAVTAPALVAMAALTRGWAAVDHGARHDAFERFMEAVRAGREAAPPVALAASIRALEVAGQARTPERLVELRGLLGDIRVSSDDERSTLAVAEGFTAFGADDFDVAFEAFARAAALADDSADPLTLLHACWAAGFAGDVVQAARLAGRGEQLARARGAMGPLTAILMSRATWEVRAARFSAAETAATEALALARETSQVGLAAIALALLARVDAVRGREAECRQRASEALAIAQARSEAQPESAAEVALADLDLAMGRPADALERLKSVFTQGHAAYRYAVIDDLIECAVRAGRADDALEPLGEWQQFARRSGVPIGDVVLARASALLAGPEDADARFGAALEAHARVPWPFVHARTELAYGEFLRRVRRKADARTQLRSALERFEALGAAPWAERAAGELRATGETARKRDASTIDQLTPQELQIARLAAEGARNRDIAGRLFLSPKTVEYHLRKIFQKLEIGSRVELIKLVSSGEAPRELAGTT